MRWPLSALAAALVFTAHPALARNVAAVDLGVGSTESDAVSISEDGKVLVGYWDDPFPLSIHGRVLHPPVLLGGAVVELQNPQRAIFPLDLNEAGESVGLSLDVHVGGPTFFYQAESWNAGGGALTLPGFGLLSVETPILVGASAINGSGEIAGKLPFGQVILGQIFVLEAILPVYWPDAQSAASVLPNLGDFAGPYPTAMNDGGVIVGHDSTQAAVWTPGPSYSLSLLPTLPGGANASAFDVNESGFVVGRGDDGSGSQTALLWIPDAGSYDVVALPAIPGGSCSEARAIDDANEIVGNCTDGSGGDRGVVWRAPGGVPEVAHVLEPLPADTLMTVESVGGASHAVGKSGSRAVLWDFTDPVVPALPGGVTLVPFLAIVLVLVGSLMRRG